MHLLIHGQKPEFPDSLPAGLFRKFDISSSYQNADTNDFLYKSDSEEYFLNRITTTLDHTDNRPVTSIIIDRDLNGEGWVRAVNLAGHIACTRFENCSLNKLPIILTDSIELVNADPTLRQVSINNIFQTEGIYFKTHDQLFTVSKNVITDAEEYAITRLQRKLNPVNLGSISVKISYDNRHQATNEWGAMRLAANFGLSDRIKFNYPRHLYFKYLTNHIPDRNEKADASLHSTFKKILLIDDNADRGWREVINQIFSCEVDVINSPIEIFALQNVTPDKPSNYDLILLDLYMETGKSTDTHAINVLKFLKKRFPHIPIIIFTASDKAWNLRKTLEQGADAMYVKESPVYYLDSEYTKQNVADFKKSIAYVSEKYRTLAPFWLGIERIMSDSNFKAIPENRDARFRSRMEERLKMFYGLLKKGYEQWEYDERTFYYTDYELAFITLWSIFNEIQEAYYEKQDRLPLKGLKDGKEQPVDKQFQSERPLTGIPGVYSWVIKGQTDYYITRAFTFEGYDADGNPITFDTPSGHKAYKLVATKPVCGLEYRRNDPPYYFNGNIERETASLELSNQIAYLILNKELLKRSPAKDSHLTSLFYLSGVRNHLFLTHGNTDAAYYATTEKTKRTETGYHIKPGQDIKQLFELVAFLLTGQDIKIMLI